MYRPLPTQLVFQITTVRSVDSGTGWNKEHSVILHGRDASGSTVCLKVDQEASDPECPVRPYFMVEPSDDLEGMSFLEKEGVKRIQVQRVPLKAYDGKGARPFLMYSFKNSMSMYIARKKLEQAGVPIYESKLEMALNLLNTKSISSSGWVSAKRVRAVAGQKGYYITTSGSISPGIAPEGMREAPFVSAAFDIETYSPDGGFPMASLMNNPIICISVVLTKTREGRIAKTANGKIEEGAFQRYALCLGKALPTESMKEEKVVVMCFDREPDLILAFLRLLDEKSVHVLSGHNILGFDMSYILGRYYLHRDQMRDFTNFRVGLGGYPSIVAMECESSANSFLGESDMGKDAWMNRMNGRRALFSKTMDKTTCTFDTFGILQVDTLPYSRRNNTELESHSLQCVSRKYLGESKCDLSIDKMMQLYREGTPEGLGVIAEYCVKDSELVLKLMDAMDVYLAVRALSDIGNVPMHYIMYRGQQIRYLSSLSRLAHKEGYCVPLNSRKRQDGDVEVEKFQGALVLDAKNLVVKDIVSLFDFASLYPSIMIGYNMCPSTVVDISLVGSAPQEGSPLEAGPDGKAICSMSSGGYSVYGVRVEEKDGSNRQVVEFVSEDTRRGLVPRLLVDMKKMRSDAKGAMKAHAKAGDEASARYYDILQNAAKIMMNSFYGSCGVREDIALVPCRRMAQSVTAQGRNLLNDTMRRVVEDCPGSKVVYGDTDSVFLRMPGSLQTLEKTFPVSTTISKKITDSYPGVIELEFEAVLSKLYMSTSKCYVALQHTSVDDPGKVIIKGMACKRKGNTKALNDAYDAMIREMCLSKEPVETVGARTRAAAMEVVKKVLNEDGGYGEEDLTQSAQISKDASHFLSMLREGKNMHAHNRVAALMEQANPGYGPKKGDRVSYVITENPNGKGNDPVGSVARPPGSGDRVDRFRIAEALFKSARILMELASIGDCEDPSALVGRMFTGCQEAAIEERARRIRIPLAVKKRGFDLKIGRGENKQAVPRKRMRQTTLAELMDISKK